MASPRTWLWQLERSAQPPSYLFGTAHVRDQRVFGQWELACRAIDTCAAFATEYRLDEQGPPPRFPYFDLHEHLSKQQLDKMARIFQKTAGLDVHAFRHLPPMLLAGLYDQHFLAQDHAVPLDLALTRYAATQQKPYFGLETLADQVAFIAAIPLQQQVQALRALGRNPAAHRRRLAKLLEYYEQCRVATLYRSSRAQSGGYRHLLLYQRNQHMGEQLHQLIEEQGSVCSAVGAAHLWGEKGMLRLMKHRGYRVRPVYKTEDI